MFKWKIVNKFHLHIGVSLCEKCPYSEFFWSVFSLIRTEYREIRSISPYLVKMLENTDQEEHNTVIFRGKLIKTKAEIFDNLKTFVSWIHL